MRELTWRAIILGGLITLVLTAANVYLGLKVGLTFATSIPAAVISMAVLSRFRGHSIVENNIVQTIASAAGTLSAIIFILPALIMVGWWSGFSYWTTAAACAIGGILGVTYSIPLRRALVTGSRLPYPEGVAAAEVLKIGDTSATASGDVASAKQENRQSVAMIVTGSLTAAAMSLLGAIKATATDLAIAFRAGSGATMVGGSLTLALVGVGHLVGVTVGVAMIIGLIISYGILLPYFTWGSVPSDATFGSDALQQVVSSSFGQDVRFIGTGTMAIAALWTLLTIAKPVTTGIRSSIASSQARAQGEQVDVTERDIPFPIVAAVTLASMLPIGVMLWLFVRGTAITHHTGGLILLSIVYTLLVGLFVAAICGYMAGLIGSSNSPISSIGILVVISAALLVKTVATSTSADESAAFIAYTLFTATVVFGIAPIANDNLQDLKTGQLVGATPWKQQVALIIGVLFGAAVIPPILQLMLTGFGFAGMPDAGPDALAAPQAALMASVAQGILGDTLNWNLLLLGAIIGAIIIAINEILSRSTGGRLALPALAVGMAMYLPIYLTLVIPLGAFLGAAYNRWAATTFAPRAAERAQRFGILMATGLIVGESLFGVLYAGIVAGTGDGDALAFLPESWEPFALWLGPVIFLGLIAFSYARTRAAAAAAARNDAAPVA